jgi:amino acid permease
MSMDLHLHLFFGYPFLLQVLSLVGATGSTTICYILPGLLYYRLRETTDTADAPKWDRSKLSAVGLAIFGFFVMIVSVSLQIRGMFKGGNGGGGPHRRDLLGVWA